MAKEQAPQTTFRWRVDARGYDLSPDGTRIVRRGGVMREYDPNALAPNLHREFAGLLPLGTVEFDYEVPGPIRFDEGLRRITSPEEAKAIGPAMILKNFVERYGFLGSDRTGADAEEESVAYLLKVQTELAYFTHFLSRGGDGRHFALNEDGKLVQRHWPVQLMGRDGIQGVYGPTLRMCLVPDESGRMVVRHQPESLYAWLWLRVADDMTSGIRWDGMPCLYCHEPMGRGPGGHRTDAKFCSEKHKTYFNRLSATEQKERRAKAHALQRTQREAQP
jgi:hypothetical protein